MCEMSGELCGNAPENGPDPLLPRAGEGPGGGDQEVQVYRDPSRPDSLPSGQLSVL